jgi:hypothetical protein
MAKDNTRCDTVICVDAASAEGRKRIPGEVRCLKVGRYTPLAYCGCSKPSESARARRCESVHPLDEALAALGVKSPHFEPLD